MTMNNYTCKSPVLLLTFNKVKETKEVFQSIRSVKPGKLYISSDGPRNLGEQKIIKDLRKYLLESIDWECEIYTKFSVENLGCRKSVSSAISWVFESEELAIILEDDCLPSLDFFRFQDEMLAYYSESESIMAVCGYKPLKEISDIENKKYYFSKYVSFWGWGTWRHAWQKYNGNMCGYDGNSSEFRKLFDSWVQYKANKNSFDDTQMKKNDSWGYRWAYSILSEQGLVIYPYYNMIKNLGFGSDSATHTLESLPPFMSSDFEKFPFPISKNNVNFEVNTRAERLYSKMAWKKKVLKREIKSALYKLGLGLIVDAFLYIKKLIK